MGKTMSKTAKLEAAMKEAQKRKKAAQDAYKAADDAEDAQGMANAQAAADRAQGDIDVLQKALDAATHLPAPLPEAEQLTASLQKYRDAHAARRDRIQAQIGDIKGRLAEIRAGMDRAVHDADTETLLTLTAERDALAAQAGQLKDILRQADDLPVYEDPEGAAEEAWANVRDVLKPAWETALDTVTQAAEAYRSAVAHAEDVQRRILQARDRVQLETDVRIRERWTPDRMDIDPLQVNRTYAARACELVRPGRLDQMV